MCMQIKDHVQNISMVNTTFTSILPPIGLQHIKELYCPIGTMVFLHRVGIPVVGFGRPLNTVICDTPNTRHTLYNHSIINFIPKKHLPVYNH